MTRLAMAAAGVALAGALFGCGSGDGDTSVKGASQTPQGFEQRGAGAKTRAAGGDYDFVHAHLGQDRYDANVNCFKSSLPPGGGGDTSDWAGQGVRTGFCDGVFRGGSSPFNADVRDNLEGRSTWEYIGFDASPPNLRGPSNEKLIRITVYLRDRGDPDNRQGIECFISDRSSNACLTNGDQAGKPAGSEGGPLSIAVEGQTGYHNYKYILVRGFCRKGDPRCTPHQIQLPY